MLILTLTIIFILTLISMLNLLPGIHTHDVMPHPTTRPALLKCTEVYFPNLDELSLRLVAALPKACIGQTGEGSGGGDGDREELYVWSSKEKQYVPLTSGIYHDIQTGKVKL